MNCDSSVCRVCLKSEDTNVDLCLKVEFLNDYTYLDLFNYCTRLDASLNDELPKNICSRCSSDLIISFQFLNQAQSSDQLLRNSIESEQECQHSFQTSEEKHDFEAEIDRHTSIIEVNAEICYEESVESQNQISYMPSPEKEESTFEIVECDSLLCDNDNPSEEYENIPEHVEVPELEVEYLGVEETLNDISSKLKSNADGHKTVECNICGKLLKRWSITHHYKRCHKKEKLHLCSACPKTFTTPSDLKIHMKTHDKFRVRNFVCTICRKGFFEKQSLGVHMLRHTGVREYQCEICQKKFTTKKSLEVHEFTHNRQNGRFVCKYCSKRFPSRADLTVHERFHTGDYPYKCELCDKSYAVKSHYNYHLAKHKGVTYKCDECDKEFMNRGSLTAHKFKHGDKMPHECPTCKKGFSSPFKLSRHQNSHKTNEDETLIK